MVLSFSVRNLQVIPVGPDKSPSLGRTKNVTPSSFPHALARAALDTSAFTASSASPFCTSFTPATTTSSTPFWTPISVSNVVNHVDVSIESSFSGLSPSTPTSGTTYAIVLGISIFGSIALALLKRKNVYQPLESTSSVAPQEILRTPDDGQNQEGLASSM